MLNEYQEFNYHTIRSFTTYACQVDDDTVEKEISFHVMLGPHTERKQDTFPVYRIPEGKMVWLSDWSFNAGHVRCPELCVGGSLGRICGEGRYIYVLNCAVEAGEMEIFSPARPIRYLADEWLAVCFHHMGVPMDLGVRATFRFTEVTGPDKPFETETFNWQGRTESERFPPAHMT